MTNAVRLIPTLAIAASLAAFQLSAEEITSQFEEVNAEEATENQIETQSITLYAPNNLVPVEILHQFTSETGILVEQHVYNNVRDPRQTSEAVNNVDLVILPYSFYPGQSTIEHYFQPIQLEKLTHKQEFKQELAGANLAPYNQYSVPLLIEGMGVATNADMLPASMVTSWSDLLDAQWSGQLMFPNDSQSMLSVALMELGYSINNASQKELTEARQWLESLASNTAFLADNDPEMHFLSGRVSIGLLTNAQAYEANIEGGNIDMVWPSEGAILDVYALSILEHSENHELAYELMNYLTRKETQLALAKHTGLTPNIEELDIDNDTLVVIPNRVIEQGQFKLTTPNNRFSYESSFRLVKNQLRLQAE
ncbi:ABC transporter [Vibrio ishigakensis]|uniref:ABC transporter n=1 Tax=Vibrio ishigakensis TaxID=1481914 RepID=A0A0B8QF49_9VIBR|nr:ABC transporter [Vibrio ishigakensis]